MVASENHSTRRSVGVLVLRDCSGRHLGPRSGYGTNMAGSINMTPNNALERTVKHGGPRLAAAQPSWSAAQLGRWASIIQLHNTINQEEKSICVTRP